MPRGIYEHRKRNAEERFWEKVDKSGDCWLWTAALDDNGYGRFWDGKTTVLAHRFAYSLVNGPIKARSDATKPAAAVT